MTLLSINLIKGAISFMWIFKVFITHNGKEVMGTVEEHRDGLVRLNLMNSDECINKREEDIRLTESRYCLYYIISSLYCEGNSQLLAWGLCNKETSRATSLRWKSARAKLNIEKSEPLFFFAASM